MYIAESSIVSFLADLYIYSFTYIQIVDELLP